MYGDVAVYERVFSIIAPLFLCAGLGYLWHRLKLPFETDFVTRIITHVGTPFLVFGTLTKLEVSAASFGAMAGATVLALLIFGLVGLALLKALKLPIPVYLPPLMFPNSGNMGLPLCLFAFGEEGLAFGIAFFAVCSIGQFTLGHALAAGHAAARQLFANPIIYMVAGALVFVILEEQPPVWVANTADILGGLAIPLMLIALGVSLSRLSVASFGRGLGFSCLRLVMGFAVGWGLATLLGFTGAARGALIIECAMPVAIFNYLFAARYNRAPEEVAGLVVLSTLISFATLPLLLLLVL